MPIEETINFKSEGFRSEVLGYSIEQLKVVEKAASRKMYSSSFWTGANAAAAILLLGLNSPIAVYKARSTYVAMRKLTIVREELQRRGEALRGTHVSDFFSRRRPGLFLRYCQRH